LTLPTYSTGTASVSVGGTTVTGVGTVWSGLNAVPGDTIVIGTSAPTIVTNVTDTTHLTIPAWTGAAQAGVTYTIYQTSSQRFSDVQLALDLKKQVQALNTEGFYYFVSPTETTPDPSLGDDGQYAFKATSGELWLKYGGAWVSVGVYKGVNPRGAWSSATTYAVNDVVSLSGSSYMATAANTNSQPPNANWMLLAAKGDKGDPATIAVGTVTTGAPGSNASVTNVGTTGAAVFDIAIPRGDPGAGDMSSVNNLSELQNKDTALVNLGGSTIGRAVFKAANASSALTPLRDGTRTVFDVYFGQSNAAAYTDDPSLVVPPNLFIWNSLGINGSATGIDVGIGFVPAVDAPRHGWAWTAAALKAWKNPLTNYYVVINAVGSNPVEQWVDTFQKTGAGFFNMYQSLTQNVSTALSTIGKTKIDNIHAWVGESNAYDADSEAFFKGLWDYFHSQMRAFSWFPWETPIYCMGYNPYDPAFPKYSRWMQEWCVAEYQTRTFVDTSTLQGAFWNPIPHMSTAGYDAAARMLYEATLGNAAKSPFAGNVKSGAYSPTIDFDTHGDLAVNYNIQNGSWLRMGNMVFGKFALRTVIGHTTAAGNFRISLPFTVKGAPWPSDIIIDSYGVITKTGTANLYPIDTQKYANIAASGFGIAWTTVGAPDIAIGQNFTMLGSFIYETSDPW
jgi:hypothetical protein